MACCSTRSGCRTGLGVTRRADRLPGEVEVDHFVPLEIPLHPLASAVDGDGVVLLGVPVFAGLPGIDEGFERAELRTHVLFQGLEQLEGEWRTRNVTCLFSKKV